MERPGFVERVCRLIGARSPHRLINAVGPGDTEVYMTRWYLWPHRRPAEGSQDDDRWRLLMHRIALSDTDRHLHDHPWTFLSVILVGAYDEEVPDPVAGWPATVKRTRRRFSIAYRPAESLHRVHLHGDRPVWTLILAGPRRRMWGYQTEKGWVPWASYWADPSLSQPDGI